MRKNVVLSVSKFIMQIFRVLISLFAAIHILIFASVLVNDIPFHEAFTEIQTLILNNTKGLKIGDFEGGTLWLIVLIIFQSLLTLVLLFSILGFGIDIIENISKTRTFSKQNVRAFNKVSQLAVVLFFVQLIKLSPERMGIAIEFNYLFLAFGSIILTQVFKEGQKLLEENELTV